MAIQVTCPNGHILHVKNKYAGKSGLCPHCHARVQVPTRESVLDDYVLEVIGPPRVPKPDKYANDEHEHVHQEPRHAASQEDSGLSLLDSSVVRRKKFCSNCREFCSFAFSHCPRCGTHLCVAPETQLYQQIQKSS